MTSPVLLLRLRPRGSGLETCDVEADRTNVSVSWATIRLDNLENAAPKSELPHLNIVADAAVAGSDRDSPCHV